MLYDALPSDFIVKIDSNFVIHFQNIVGWMEKENDLLDKDSNCVRAKMGFKENVLFQFVEIFFEKWKSFGDVRRSHT